MEDKTLTAQEAGQLVAAAQNLSTANSAQGQRVIALLTGSVNALQAAAANAESLTARMAKLEAQFQAAQRRLAQRDNG